MLRAKEAVVANCSVWDLPKLLPGTRGEGLHREAGNVPECESFLHLHAGLDATGLPPPEELGIHHLVVRDWNEDVDSPLNVINISIPTVLDPSLAPEGKHTVHVYGTWTPLGLVDRYRARTVVALIRTHDRTVTDNAPVGAANESFDTWAGLERGSAAYNALKEERAAVLWEALERGGARKLGTEEFSIRS